MGQLQRDTQHHERGQGFVYFYFLPIALVIMLVLVGTISCSSFRGLGRLKGPDERGGLNESEDSDSQADQSSTDAESYLDDELLEQHLAKQKRVPPRLRKPTEPFSLIWPVRHVYLNQGFSPAKNPDHRGIDLGGRRGDTIFAAHEGLVIYTGRDFRGFGKMVIVEYDNQWATLYAHLNKISARQGQWIEQGEVIGAMGRTGHATGVHLHFELLNAKKSVDPLPWLPKRSDLVDN